MWVVVLDVHAVGKLIFEILLNVASGQERRF